MGRQQRRDHERIYRYLYDKVFVTPEADGSMRLDIRIFTGDSAAKYIEKLRRRTDHTFKKKKETVKDTILHGSF